jgi:hypothetical protein
VTWLLVLLTVGSEPVIVRQLEHGHECRALALALNSPKSNSQHVANPRERYACFALDSII